MQSSLKFVAFALCVLVPACGLDAGGSTADEEAVGNVQSASSTPKSWPYPVPTGCVALPASPSQCQTNVGHYDVIQAEASLDANMAAAGYIKAYSNDPLCRTNDSYTKGKTRVCYRVGIVEDAHFQAIGSQWSGFLW